MKILVFGAGVVGTAYAWQLSLAGHDVALLVRPGRKQELERQGIAISCFDMRKIPWKHLTTTYHPHVVEDFSPADGYALILVCVRSTQLQEALPHLAAKAGEATILFVQNNWSGRAEIEQYLAPARYLLGFPSVGGGRDAQSIQCALGASMRLGEPDGRLTTRLRTIAAVMRQADIKPRLTRRIIPWLWAHYAGIAAVGAGLCQAGSLPALASSAPILKDTLLAGREALAVCRARGIQLWRVPDEALPFLLPAWLFVPFMRRFLHTEVARLGLEGHADGYADDEVRAMYENVLNEGESLGVKMPHLRGFQQYIEHVVPIVNAGRRGAVSAGENVVTPR